MQCEISCASLFHGRHAVSGWSVWFIGAAFCWLDRLLVRASSLVFLLLKLNCCMRMWRPSPDALLFPSKLYSAGLCAHPALFGCRPWRIGEVSASSLVERSYSLSCCACFYLIQLLVDWGMSQVFLQYPPALLSTRPGEMLMLSAVAQPKMELGLHFRSPWPLPQVYKFSCGNYRILGFCSVVVVLFLPYLPILLVVVS